MNRESSPEFVIVGWVTATLIAISCSENGPTGPSTSLTTGLLVQQLQSREAAVSIAEVMPSSSFPFFSVNAQRLIVNGQNVHVFEYTDASAAQNDVNRVAPSGSSVGSTQITWIDRPRFYRSSQLIVLYVGSDASVATHLEAILGAPFAGS
jgi:hypothetical protein